MSTQRGFTLAGVLAACCLGLVAPASAQHARAGVSIDALRAGLAEHGLEVREIEIPDVSDVVLPVRLALGAPGAQTASALLDVHVAASVIDARAWAAERAETASTRRLVARDARTSSDTASGAASIVVGSHANVVFEVRVIDPTLDASILAAIARAAIDASPADAPRARALPPPQLPRDLAVGASAPIQLPSGVAAARVVATGAGYARRAPRGWFVTRTAEGPIDVRILAVDPLLRPLPIR